MVKKLLYLCFSGMLIFMSSGLKAQSDTGFGKYHTNREIQQLLKGFSSGNAKLHTIAESPGGEPITVLEIGANLSDVPAIFVGANFEGDAPLASEGALFLAKMLLDSTAYTKDVKWYIMPQPNPDAAAVYFSALKTGQTTNQFKINNDGDEAIGEDGPDDLNGDGLITQMRIKSIEGSYIVSDSDARLMKKADKQKGERGTYKVLTEGIDNDKDGKYNEDAVGGINVGIGFPHLFPYENKDAGLFAGQTPEVYGILRFIYDRPEIAMVYTLGNSNFCLVPPKGGRKGDANLDRIKIPRRYASMLNADASKTYTMDEAKELFKTVVPEGTEVTTSLVASYLSLGPALNPLEDDLVFYKKYAEDYKKYLKGKDFSTETLDPTPAKDGSFELWAYYHLGVPSFSMRLFSVPKVKEAESDESADSKEKEKKAAPAKKDESGDKEKALLAYSESELDGAGFVAWTKVDHPDFDEVEVGGFAPYIETTPKAEKIESLAATQLPWLLHLSTELPDFAIADKKVTDMGGGIYKLELYVANNGALPYPISMGQRNGQPAPVIVTLEGDMELLEGKLRTPVGAIGANQVKKYTWLLKANKNKSITAGIESAVFTDVVEQIKIGG
ncbi:M14 family metallopeptidase [Draconibacterium sp. IB214405]|uniref:M14 family metallopeptidase n=1 Tax=Draconibacterium sp. IB214405 TaxID=3097352 RepID=UPI002A0CD645|nr:M14 family metallopeptidase [Draconibacterium sp. IB214405]MDX8340249.1 M14 family metallopeptidase [Draconibacterium sp. IB214405]